MLGVSKRLTRAGLLIAALKGCSIQGLVNAPNFQIHLATGDSLLHGPRPGSTKGVQVPLAIMDDTLATVFETEDKAMLKEILSTRYHVVAGNPPYINVQDPALRDGYRARFASCSGKYQMTVPFIERFFDLAVGVAGYVAMIGAIAFTKQAFGKKLISNYLSANDLTHIIDTSRAHIPEHGTPTVILLGRSRSPQSPTVRVVQGIRAESTVPANASQGAVWRAITAQVDTPDSESKWVSVADVDRQVLREHPWSIGGGGASDLKQRIEDACNKRLSEATTSIGITSFTLADDVYMLPRSAARRLRISAAFVRDMVIGESVRDWSIIPSNEVAVFPYLQSFDPIRDNPADPTIRYLWPARTILANTVLFGRMTKVAGGLLWYEFGRLTASKLRLPLSVVFSHVATHSHATVDRGGHLFNSHAPVMKLPPNSSQDEHADLAGLFNSSTGLFWLKQVCHNKGGGGIGGGLATEAWEQFYELSGTNVAQLPISERLPTEIANAVQTAADARTELLPHHLIRAATPRRDTLISARNHAGDLLRRMIALQEELDWHVYHLYNLTEEPLTLPLDQIPEIELGQRAFEIVMARAMRDGELETTWFERHGSKPITEIPTHWPEPYRELVQRRIDLIARDRDIALIEQPEYKRRWNLPSWEEQEHEALQSWLLDKLEAPNLWPSDEPVLRTVAQLADCVSHDPDFAQVAALYLGTEAIDYVDLVRDLIMKESVPFLPVLRYKESGMSKRHQWEQVWDLQRREDAGEKVEIQPPPKYAKEDFLPGPYWSLRGKLDVPKERWILYPHLERSTDSTPVLAWAGYDHAQQARALAGYYQFVRSEEGWERDRLIPILAGLQELMPWLHQWHPGEIADVIGEMLRGEMAEFALTEADLRDWRPAAATAARRTTRRRTRQ